MLETPRVRLRSGLVQKCQVFTLSEVIGTAEIMTARMVIFARRSYTEYQHHICERSGSKAYRFKFPSRQQKVVPEPLRVPEEEEESARL